MHGVSLPPLGSFEFTFLLEGIQRQRSEKVAFARFLSHFLAPLSNMDQEKVRLLVAEYAEEVLQFKYNYKYQSALSRAWESQIVAKSEELRILDKVSEMTVDDA